MTRVWDRFLTAQDKAHLAQRRGDRRIGFGRNPAILNIDLYRGVFGDENLPLLDGVKQWPGYCGPAAWDTIPHVQALIREARVAGVPVCHATGLLDEESGIPGWSQAIHAGSPRRVDLSDPTARERFARRYDIIDEVAPQEGDVVVRKTAPSAFWGTPLVAELIRLGVDTLLVTGESTSGCLRASVIEGVSYGYPVAVVADGVFDRHSMIHKFSLLDLHLKYATVIDLAAAVGAMRAHDAKLDA